MSNYSVWNFRPTALNFGDNYYEKCTRRELFDRYLNDGKKAKSRANKIEQKEGGQHESKVHGGIPDPPSSTSMASPPYFLRTTQWNIHSLSAPWEKESSTCESLSDLNHTKNVAKTLLQTKSEIMILNEYYSSNQAPLRMILEREGYKCYTPRQMYNFPTVIFTKLPITKFGTFQLDNDRSAVYVEVMINENDSNSDSPQYVSVYGTHLDHMDVNKGKKRLEEAKVLLQNVETLNYENGMAKNPTLIIGDLNQQRKKDYTEQEWDAIRLNKTYRRAPFDDGVASLLEGAGFYSNFDPFACSSEVNNEEKLEGERSAVQCKCNWNPEEPPPATHWSSTVIDFAYARESQEGSQTIEVDGVYVSPSTLSDHRMVVCDWKIKSRGRHN